LKEKHWQHFYHQADIGVRGIGPNLSEAFEQAALAMMAVICNPENVALTEQIDIERTCDDNELLLADWLNALIYEMATRNMLFGKFQVHIEDGKLTANAWGEKADPEKHETAVEVKGATYTELKVEQDKDELWIAQCVVDV
jgi:SHS2 domain-containing protein